MTLDSEQKGRNGADMGAGRGARAEDRDLGGTATFPLPGDPSSVSLYSQLTQHTLPSPGDKGGLLNHRPVEMARSGQEASRSRAHTQVSPASS